MQAAPKTWGGTRSRSSAVPVSAKYPYTDDRGENPTTLKLSRVLALPIRGLGNLAMWRTADERELVPTGSWEARASAIGYRLLAIGYCLFPAAGSSGVRRWQNVSVKRPAD